MICFCSFFGRIWRHQKDISKLTDLWREYFLVCVRLWIWLFLNNNDNHFLLLKFFLTSLIQFWNLFTPMWTLQGSPQRVFSCLCTTLDMTREDCYVSLDFFRRSHGCFRWSTFPIYKSHKNMKGQWPPSYITHFTLVFVQY